MTDPFIQNFRDRRKGLGTFSRRKDNGGRMKSSFDEGPHDETQIASSHVSVGDDPYFLPARKRFEKRPDVTYDTRAYADTIASLAQLHRHGSSRLCPVHADRVLLSNTAENSRD